MTNKQKERLIEALEIRQKQLTAGFNDMLNHYQLHDGHHMRDVSTVLSVLRNEGNADNLLERLPTEKDLPFPSK